MSASLLMALLPAFAASAQTVVSTPPSGELRVTVYQGKGALFSERRRVTVTAGVNDLQLAGMPSGLEATPVDLQVLSGPVLRLIEQRVLPAADRPRHALAALIGQTIALLRDVPGANEPRRLEGTLLNVSKGGGVGALQVGDRVLLDPVGEVQVTPEQLALLTHSTTLLCRVESAAAGEADLLLSCLASEASWEAQHSLVLSEDGATMSLVSWAAVRVPGAAGLTASLRLAAGDAADPEAHDLGRPVAFDEAGSVRPALAEAAKVPVASLTLFEAGTLAALAGGKPITGPVSRVIRFDDTAASGLGVNLPSGKAVVYRRTPGAGASLVSQATMPPAKDGATVDLILGEAPGLRATSKQASWRQLSPEDIERRCEVLLTNATGAAQTVTCGVTMSGQWKIADASHPYTVRRGNRVEFTVPLAADEKSVTLAYTVRIQTPPESGQPKSEKPTAPPVPGGEEMKQEGDEGSAPRPSPGGEAIDEPTEG